MWCMPVSAPWYACSTSSSICLALRRSPGAKGWFHSVNRNESGSGVVCYKRTRGRRIWGQLSQKAEMGVNQTYGGDFVELPLDGEAEMVQICGC